MKSKSIYVKILFDFWSPIQQHNTPSTLFSLIYFDTIFYVLQEIDYLIVPRIMYQNSI
jgi:hypothetical protein